MKRFFILFILAVILMSSIQVYAASDMMTTIQENYNNVIWVHDLRLDEWHLIAASNYITYSYINQWNDMFSEFNISVGRNEAYYICTNAPIKVGDFSFDNYYLNQNYFYIRGNDIDVILLKGQIQGINYITWEDYERSNSNWVTDAWDVITDYFGFTGKPFSWIVKLKTFWKNRFDGIRGFWNNLFNRDNNGDIVSDLYVLSPTPLPSAPTPIPYNTFVEFDTQNNTYIYKYSYIDENNTTIVVTSPPDGGNGTGLRPTSEPIIDNYYPSDPLDVPRDNNMWSPQFTINLGDGQTLDIDMNTLNDTLIQGAEPYVDNVDVASDMFSVIPNDWWMLIGFVACIPLICAIISRFLG